MKRWLVVGTLLLVGAVGVGSRLLHNGAVARDAGSVAGQGRAPASMAARLAEPRSNFQAGGGATADPRLAKAEIDVIDESYATADGAFSRRAAIVAAGKLGTPESVAWLASVAGSDPQQGAAAGAALGQVRDSRAAAKLAEVATGDGPVIARANAARALGASGAASEAPALTRLVEDASQPLRVRQEAALSLGHVDSPEVVVALGEVLEAAAADRSPAAEQLRISIVQALGRIGTEQAWALVARHAERTLTVTERAFVERVGVHRG